MTFTSYEPNKGELLSKFLVYKFEHITKKGRMCVIMISFSQLGFMDQRCSETPQWVTNKMDIRGRYSAEGHCYLQYSQPNSPSFGITNGIDNLFTTSICSHMMSTNGSPPKTTNMAPSGGQFGSQQRAEDNVGASDNNAGNTPSKDTQFGQPQNQIHPPLGYSYRPSQPPFPGAPQFHHPAPFNMTPSSQPSSGGATQAYQCYGPSWQG
jgi:hypothetical protein